jgi:outer membrane protein TolC
LKIQFLCFNSAGIKVKPLLFEDMALREHLRLLGIAAFFGILLGDVSGKAQPTGTNQTIALAISLQEAIHRAQQNEPAFAAALADQRSAAIDRYLAKAALLPSAIYHNQMIYTQPNGETIPGGQATNQSAPIFIANNAVHEYVSQASLNEMVGVKQFADIRLTRANAARTEAELEVARRGLVAAVVGLYYGVSNAETKRSAFKEALDEAHSFTDHTQKREAAREVAHADVVKAQLQEQQRQRDLSDAEIAVEKARLELAVLLFPDPRTPYSVEPPASAQALPTREEVNAAAARYSPEIRSAMAALEGTGAAILAAKGAYLPDLALNFSYGIDAPQFAKRGPDGVQNLGYSITGTLDIPVWDWLSTQKRIRQTQIRRDAARVTLSATQRRLIANLDEAYSEAQVAQQQLDLLDQSLHTAEESLRLTKLRYTAGEATALEVVDAQTAYTAAQTAQADGVVRYQTALAELQLLTGTL